MAIILHKRWVKAFRAFHATSERVCALDLDIHRKRFRFLLVYMPTAWHQDPLVEGAYHSLSGLCTGARRLKRSLMVFGDFNAVVGRPSSEDDPKIVGNH